ncbi:MAG: hypothetical protein FWD33_02140 [Alphaproteobacteria bacterium]|nr:hypothetical protein [Alphaproteobacteria bacterium]
MSYELRSLLVSKFMETGFFHESEAHEIVEKIFRKERCLQIFQDEYQDIQYNSNFFNFKEKIHQTVQALKWHLHSLTPKEYADKVVKQNAWACANSPNTIMTKTRASAAALQNILNRVTYREFLEKALNFNNAMFTASTNNISEYLEESSKWAATHLPDITKEKYTGTAYYRNPEMITTSQKYIQSNVTGIVDGLGQYNPKASTIVNCLKIGTGPNPYVMTKNPAIIMEAAAAFTEAFRPHLSAYDFAEMGFLHNSKIFTWKTQSMIRNIKTVVQKYPFDLDYAKYLTGARRHNTFLFTIEAEDTIEKIENFRKEDKKSSIFTLAMLNPKSSR